MNFNKIISLLFFSIFFLSAQSVFSQVAKENQATSEATSKPIKKSDKMKLAPSSKAKSQKNLSTKSYDLAEKKNAVDKNEKLYSSKSAIRRAKEELAKKKTAGKLSKKEIQEEEERIRVSAVQLSKSQERTSPFSKKLKKAETGKKRNDLTFLLC